MKIQFKSIKNNIKRAKSNKDAQTLVSNFAYLSILQVIGYIFPLLTVPYLAKVIGVVGYGKIAFAASIIVYFQTFVDWGFTYTAVRDIAKCKNDMQKVSMIFSTVIMTKIFLFVIALVIFGSLIYIIPFMHDYRDVLWYTFLMIPGTILFPDWFFQAMEEMKYITIMNLIYKTIFTLLIFIFINKESDYIYQPCLNAIGTLCSGLWGLWYAKKKFHLCFIKPNCSQITTALNRSKNMFISLIFPNLYSNFSNTLLGYYGGDIANGLYSAGKYFVDISDRIAYVLSRTFFPYLARHLDKHNLYVKISGFISISICLFLFIFADVIMQLFYTPEFYKASTVLRIMSIAPFFLFLMNTFGTNYLVLKGREDILRNIIIVCSVVGFICLWFTTIYFSYIGVAITVTSIWGIRGFITWIYAKKIKSSKI